MVAYNFREPFSQSIHAEPPWNRFLAMLILYVGTSLVVWVAFRMVSGTIDRFKLREFDRQIGAMFGLAKGALYCILITLFAVTLFGDSVREKIVGSKSGNYIASVLARSESVIPPEIQEVVQPYLDRFEKRFNSNDSQDTPAGFLEGVGRSVAGDAARGVLPESLWDDGSGNSAGRAPLPVDPRGWNSGQSVPQQAQQPWNGFQR